MKSDWAEAVVAAIKYPSCIKSGCSVGRSGGHKSISRAQIDFISTGRFHEHRLQISRQTRIHTLPAKVARHSFSRTGRVGYPKTVKGCTRASIETDSAAAVAHGVAAPGLCHFASLNAESRMYR